MPEHGVRHAADPADAAALLRLVEDQARDLIKLRRALIGLNSIAQERLKIIERGVAPLGESSEIPVGECSEIPVGECSEAPVGEISEKVLRPRRRKIVRKVRKVRKRLRRSTKSFRKVFDGIGRILGSENRIKLDRDSEIERVICPMEPEPRGPQTEPEPRDDISPMEPEPCGRETEEGPSGDRADIRLGSGFLAGYSMREFLEACRSFGTDVILDVGANTGQFAQNLRDCGYTGHLVSFEPLSDAHVRLVKAAANDALWDIVGRCASGRRRARRRSTSPVIRIVPACCRCLSATPWPLLSRCISGPRPVP